MRSGSRPLRRWLIIGSLIIALVAGSLFWGISYYANSIPREIDLTSLTDRPSDTPGTTFLLVGSDDRTGLSRKQRAQLKLGKLDYGRHTDTMMLLHVSETGGRMAVVSIPRDSYVTVPGWRDEDGREFAEEQNRINVAYGRGGPALAVATVERATGLRIDHYLEVDFAGFTQIVEAVGGVEICVETPLKDAPSGLDVPAGRSLLDPAQSLAFVRARQLDASSDLSRVERQRTFVLSLGKKVMNTEMLSDPARLHHTIKAIASSLRADTELLPVKIIGIASSLRAMEPKKIEMMTVPIDKNSVSVPGVGSVVLWNETKAKRLFEKIANDLPNKDRESSAVENITASQVKVNVFNASGVKGLATEAVRDLESAGFVVPDPAANWGASGAKVTVIRHSPENLSAARMLAENFALSRLEEAAELGDRLDLLVGGDWGKPNLPSTGVSQGLCS